jgi:uncharacterized protein YwqG
MAIKDDLSVLSEAQLVAAYIDNVKSYEAIEHVGSANRHMNRRLRIEDELAVRSGGTLQSLRALLEHPDPNVRRTVAIKFRTIDHDAFVRTVGALAERADEIGRKARQSLELDAHFQKVGYPELQKDAPRATVSDTSNVHWQSANPPPRAMARVEIAQRLFDSLPTGGAERLLQLALPAIGLWPQRPPSDLPTTASRLGGLPVAPPDWSWPVAATEPMLFLGHINCAELHGLPGAERLPSSGLLAFFGDHDSVTGCLLTAAGVAVFYWPDIDRLVPATSLMDPLKIFPPSALAFRSVIDLPHPNSRVVETILSDREQSLRYSDLYKTVRNYGIPDDVRYYCGFGKLFGWPCLIQNELEELTAAEPNGLRLLLQIDPYTNGKEGEDWGPGGSLYFLIRNADLRARRFDRCTYEMQFT